MDGRLPKAVLLLVVIACSGGHRAGAQAIRVNPGVGQVPGGIGGVGAVGALGLGSGLNTGIGIGQHLNLNTSLRSTLPTPSHMPITNPTGSEYWDPSPSHDDDSSDRWSESIHVNNPSCDQDRDDRLISSNSHPAVSTSGDPPDPPEDGDDGGGDEDDEDEEDDEEEGRGIPWFWVVVGIVALVVIFRR
jgi:hypothetical protein